MMTTGEEIFWANARGVLRDIGMPHLDWAHGAAVNIVRLSLNVRDRPTHHQQAFLEAEAPAVLAYLEKLSASGDIAGWRALQDRIRSNAELLRETNMQPCARPWLAAIWHTLPEIAGLGQCILDRLSEHERLAPDAAPIVSEAITGAGGDGDKGSAGEASSAGTSAKPRPRLRLALPAVAVKPTPAEEKALGFDNDATKDAKTKNDTSPDGPDGTTGSAGPRPPGGPK
ncbi:hypothetical protein [Rhizobium rhizogenes]|uniref:hypothetical protein n=1 Tax=Rhizobium rhizogenes TaxID=359 RepID=UPI0012959B06|nr:hypothetical protein [Rhizobium rhizogenes]MQB34737.1 hypothetical protein [Rhizobium rhizogenes]